ncbi:MAG TPA: 16S rRNA (guanine(966)-N(2))-methyltransferase RsmD [Anaerohalosphaeraceae bacterium]|jgi:16S rRNA (guanine966-N2)-methyltransferase|nr:16S rRNA (guanine(966)-N(2))-methyltransferase RsmD [Anaerohalosphaeraceae bacterium]HRT49825.1 16S rRNA (guanine(966)-N(2))-methyltransferase RsmD [Anaerohalosphaeraceae bacterium]HRT87044.1 16S rRNA (guanine(966)-N(2))-methyltransferase RsmD [Anaerohalosphaeraceae bacterium]
MRIIGGSKRGMGLLGPKGRTVTRPITDRVKQSLFNVLYKYDVIEGGVVADVFCGTGSMGLEALSRGARWVTFVEQDRSAAELLERNIAKAGFVGESKVIRANAWKVGAPVQWELGPYGLVFVDPPYKMSYDTSSESPLGRLLVLLCEQVAAGGIVAVRTHERAELLDVYGGMRVIDRRRWGTMAIALLQVEGGTAGHDEPGTGDQDYSASE